MAAEQGKRSSQHSRQQVGCNLAAIRCVHAGKVLKSQPSTFFTPTILYPMRSIFLLLIFIGLFAFFKMANNSSRFFFDAHTKGHGPVVSEQRSLQGFHAIDLQDAADVEISIGDHYAVEVLAQQNLQPLLKTEVKDSTLVIYTDESWSSSAGTTVKVTAPAYSSLILDGSGTIRCMTPLVSPLMQLSLSGSGDIYLLFSTFQQVKCGLDGSGRVHLAGTTNTLDVDISGSGDVVAPDMTVNELTASISGSGNLSANVLKSLKADVSGSGDVRYKGQPTVQSSVSGSGSVSRL